MTRAALAVACLVSACACLAPACASNPLGGAPADLAPADPAPNDLPAPIDFANDFAKPKDFAMSIDFAMPIDLAAPMDAAVDASTPDDLSPLVDGAPPDWTPPPDFVPSDLAVVIPPACAADNCTAAMLGAFQTCWMPMGPCAEVTTRPTFNRTLVTECYADHSTNGTNTVNTGYHPSTQTYTSSSGVVCAIIDYSYDQFGAQSISIRAGGHTWDKSWDTLNGGYSVTCDYVRTTCDLASVFPDTSGSCPQASTCP